MVLVALPFVVVGVMAAADAMDALSRRAHAEAVSAGIFALAFTGVGLGVMIGSIYGARKEARTRALKAIASGKPWRGRQDWAMGRIVSTGGHAVGPLWGFTGVWNLVSSYVLFMLPGELRDENRFALIGLIFPLTGVGLFIRAVLASVRRRRLGTATFEMFVAPASIGGRLIGRITTDQLPAHEESIRLRLSCLRHEGGRGFNGERLIWEAEKTVAASAIHPTRGIPVEFDIPAHCEPASAPRSSPPYIKWVLQVTPSVPGANHAPRFDVPVFRTIGGPGMATVDAPEPGRP